MILNPVKVMPGLLGACLMIFGLLFVTTACAGDSAPTSTPTTAPDPNPTSTATPVPPTPVPTPVNVVTTTNIVADWVENIGGEHVEVFSLLPIGADPHAFQPGARDVAKIADADLVLSIGLGLEESWIRSLLEGAAQDPSSIVELGEHIDPIEFEDLGGHGHEGEDDHGHMEDHEDEDDHGHEEDHEDEDDHGHEEDHEGEDDHGHEEDHEDEDDHGHEEDHEDEGDHEGEDDHEGHDHGPEDPHFWFDPIRVKIAVDEIVSLLSDLDPEQADTYETNASAFKAELDDLHSWTEEQVSVVPEENRLLVTSHDSLGYFANLYGFEVVGVILSTTTEVDPSAEDLAELVHEIEETGAKAVFGETTVSERLAVAVAAEAGVELYRLYSGSLGVEGSGAETYITMVRTNVSRIVEALR